VEFDEVSRIVEDFFATVFEESEYDDAELSRKCVGVMTDYFCTVFDQDNPLVGVYNWVVD
jgi:hypothetical protein